MVSWQEGRTEQESPADLSSSLLSPRPLDGYHEDLRSPQFFTGKFKSIFAFEDPRLAEIQFAEDIRGFPDNNSKGKSSKYKKARRQEIEANTESLERRPLLDERLIVDIPTEWITRTDFYDLNGHQRTAAESHTEPNAGITPKTDSSEEYLPSSSFYTQPSTSKYTQTHRPHGDVDKSQHGALSIETPRADVDQFNDLDLFRQSLTELLMSNETICQNILRDVILKLNTNIDRKVRESPEACDASALHEMALRTLCSKNETEAPSGSDVPQQNEVEEMVENAVEETVQDYLVKALVEQDQAQGPNEENIQMNVGDKNNKAERLTLPDICHSMPAPGTSESVSPGSLSADTLSERVSDKDWSHSVSPQRLSNRSSSSDVTKESKSQSADILEDNLPQQFRRNKGVHFQVGDDADDVKPKLKRATTPRLQRALAIDIKDKPKDRHFRSKSQESSKAFSSKELTVNKELPVRKADNDVANIPKSPMTYREKAQRARARMRHQLRPSMSMPVTSSATSWSLSDAASNDSALKPSKTSDARSSASSSRRCASLEEHYDVVTSHHVLHALTSFPSIQADDIRGSRRPWSQIRSASDAGRRSASVDRERALKGRRTRSLEYRQSSVFLPTEAPPTISSKGPHTTCAFATTSDAVFKTSPEKIPKIESIDSYFRSYQSVDSDSRNTETTDSYFRRPRSASRHFEVSSTRRKRSKSSEEYGTQREGLLQTSL